MVNTICQHCKVRFLVKKSELSRGNGKFCSISCAVKHRKKPKKPNYHCSWCKTPFYLKPARKHGSKSGLYFCSRGCKDMAQSIGGLSQIQPGHYGSTETNYRAIAFRNHLHVCNRCGYSDMRILVAHHKDRDRKNNEVDNLEILCPNCHAFEHLSRPRQ